MTGARWMSNFRPIDRDTGLLLPPSVDEWLLEKHMYMRRRAMETTISSRCH
jgi:hypothetical protein